MKKYTKPNIDIIPADANILSNSIDTLPIFQGGDKYNIDDYTITDGSQILTPKNHLWDEEEE